MKNPFLMHVFVALVWLFLSGNTTMGNFFLALAVTYVLLALFRKAIGCEDYIRRVRALVKFLVQFFREVIASNLRVMRLALLPKARSVRGYFLRYPVEDLNDFETLLLSVCIGLSPGTMVADRSPDGREIVLHVFGTSQAEEVCASIDRTLKSGILSFTR